MQISHELKGGHLLVNATGRLDAGWSEYFSDTILAQIRLGHHQMLMDFSEVSFLSSAGIRALMQVYKELLKVEGKFLIINCNEFIRKTLETSGFQMWLAGDLPDEATAPGIKKEEIIPSAEIFILNEKAGLKLSLPAKWQPWQKIDNHLIKALSCNDKIFALGIGSAADSINESRMSMGEFLAVAGNVTYQPPDEDGRPDYLLAENEFVPQLNTIQAMVCSGEMSHLIRFSADDEHRSFLLSEIAEMALHLSKSRVAAFVILAEIEGLVGARLIQSPGFLEEDRKIEFPEVREWLWFSGEKVFPSEMALVFGLVSDSVKSPHHPLLNFSAEKNFQMHAHAAAFPYQPLQNGNIGLNATVRRFFNGPAPLAVMHLTDDNRPLAGLGQSTFVRGACWCSSIKNPEELL